MTIAPVNAFGTTVPQLPELLSNPETRQRIQMRLESVLETLSVQSPVTSSNDLLTMAAGEYERDAFEAKAHRYLAEQGVTSRVPTLLSGRAQQEFSQVQTYLQGESVLDFGCGDGKVGALVAKAGYATQLADVYKNPHVDQTRLPFAMIPHTGAIDLPKADTTLLLTVLHHSKKPMETLENAIANTVNGGRIIVIESVYGTDGKRSATEQWKEAFFFDRFYNNVITDPALGVHTPGNYQTAQGWTERFEERGLKQLQRIDLGVDLPIVPEHHVLYVLEKVTK